MNIYVGNLSSKTSESHLRKAFGRFGTVGKISMEAQSADSTAYRFCFIEMPVDSQACAAISTLSGNKMDNCVLTIKESGVTV